MGTARLREILEQEHLVLCIGCCVGLATATRLVAVARAEGMHAHAILPRVQAFQASLLPLGTPVRLHSLASRMELNGQSGLVVQGRNGRVGVRLRSGSSVAVQVFKVEDLRGTPGVDSYNVFVVGTQMVEFRYALGPTHGYGMRGPEVVDGVDGWLQRKDEILPALGIPSDISLVLATVINDEGEKELKAKIVMSSRGNLDYKACLGHSRLPQFTDAEWAMFLVQCLVHFDIAPNRIAQLDENVFANRAVVVQEFFRITGQRLTAF